MIETALITVALLACGVVFQMRIASRAPVGYQDETGFHLGAPEFAPSGDTEFLPKPTFAFPNGRQHGPTPRPVVAVSGHHA